MAAETMKGKVALVTGSTTGIGKGIAQGLAGKGCSVVLTGLASEQEIEELLQEFRRLAYLECSSFFIVLTFSQSLSSM